MTVSSYINPPRFPSRFCFVFFPLVLTSQPYVIPSILHQSYIKKRFSLTPLPKINFN